MSMKPIDSSRAPGQASPITTPADARRPVAKGQPAKVAGDEIQFSDQARRLTGDAATSREARVEEARRKLLAGELDTPEVIEKTAEKMLKPRKLDVDA